MIQEQKQFKVILHLTYTAEVIVEGDSIEQVLADYNGGYCTAADLIMPELGSEKFDSFEAYEVEPIGDDNAPETAELTLEQALSESRPFRIKTIYKDDQGVTRWSVEYYSDKQLSLY